MLKYSETRAKKNFPPQIAFDIRVLFRKIGLIHAYERSDKLFTFDIPFFLMATEDGSKIVVVIEKSCIPRSYPTSRILSARSFFMNEMGFLTEIRENKNAILISLNQKIPQSDNHLH